VILRLVLLLILASLLLRAWRRIAAGISEGLSGTPSHRVPTQGVQMVRDPVCGTYVVPDRAVALTDGSQRLFFCSDRCRDAYRQRRP
jgi:uncharacterized protein